MRKHAAALAKTWWPELLCAALLSAVACAGQPDDLLFAIFCAVTGAIFWAMGFRHRRTPLHARIDRISETVTEVRDLLADDGGDRAGGDSARPVLRLVD